MREQLVETILDGTLYQDDIVHHFLAFICSIPVFFCFFLLRIDNTKIFFAPSMTHSFVLLKERAMKEEKCVDMTYASVIF
jgi:hypothetical protein